MPSSFFLKSPFCFFYNFFLFYLSWLQTVKIVGIKKFSFIKFKNETKKMTRGYFTASVWNWQIFFLCWKNPFFLHMKFFTSRIMSINNLKIFLILRWGCRVAILRINWKTFSYFRDNIIRVDVRIVFVMRILWTCINLSSRNPGLSIDQPLVLLCLLLCHLVCTAFYILTRSNSLWWYARRFWLNKIFNMPIPIHTF